MTTYDRVVLIGFSGTGKTTVASGLAHQLGWHPRDTDAEIEARLGRSIPEVFAHDGEQFFRAEERRTLLDALARQRVVIATGGGAILADELWSEDALKQPRTLVIALEASPETIWARLSSQAAAEGRRAERPLLAGSDPLTRMCALKAERQPIYDRAALTLSTDRLTPGQLIAEIVSILDGQRPRASTLTLDAPSGRSEIVIGAGTVDLAGHLTRQRWPTARRVWIAADANTVTPHGERVAAVFRASGFTVEETTVAPGEGSKGYAGAAALHDWLLNGGVERGDVVVALGGGVIGDLVGFVAATCLRGLGLVQIPTTLLAMVDSSVGGKTGINHAAGKNLIGVFYQPPLVVIDPDLLATLPPRELTSGWAEIIKHGVIQQSTPGGERGDLFSSLERMVDVLVERGEPGLSWLIRRNVGLKAAVVAADEREAGLRAILNFGHTFGHAIEASDYRLLHGEAVGIGMIGAAHLGRELGLIGEELVVRLVGLIARFGLPVHAPADPEAIWRLMGSDKKRTAGRQRWVLPVEKGGVEVRDDVPAAAVERALALVTGR